MKRSFLLAGVGLLAGAFLLGRAAADTTEAHTRQKLQKLIIPRIEFKEANIVDVLTFFSMASVEADTAEKTGVNIILKTDAAALATVPITLTLHGVNLLDAIVYVCRLAKLDYRVDKNCVLITQRADALRSPPPAPPRRPRGAAG